jgi:hypothetical protein
VRPEHTFRSTPSRRGLDEVGVGASLRQHFVTPLLLLTQVVERSMFVRNARVTHHIVSELYQSYLIFGVKGQSWLVMLGAVRATVEH